MTTAEFKLNLNRASIVIDGHDLANHITGFTLTAEPGRPPKLQIDLRVYDVTALGDECTELRIDQGTVDLLKRCGWTAPEGDPTILRTLPTA